MQKGQNGDKPTRSSYTVQLGTDGYDAAVELAEILKLSMSQVVSRLVQSVRRGPIQLQVLLTEGVVTSSSQEEYRREIVKYIDELLKDADRTGFSVGVGVGRPASRVAAKKRGDKSE